MNNQDELIKKIDALPDDHVFEATPWTRIDSSVNDGFVEDKHVEFNTDDLKSLSQRVKDLEAALGMIAGLHQCPDNLMSDKDIAREALEKKQ